ncbi:MAG: hypothetical protein K2M02_11915 [Duncaniella sp.]|nr:hypothetical protein [Duncaniella sp.]
MKKAIYGRCCATLAAVSVLALASCVDNDYDLSKDIDMTINVGGNLTLPPSSTEPYTMEQILNLDANSSIKPVGLEYGFEDGDYVLVQDGTASPSTFKIDEVTLSDLAAASSDIELNFVGVGDDMRVSADVVDLTNDLDLRDDNVDRQLVSLQQADVDIKLNIELSFTALDNYHGSIFIERGFEIAFPDGWTIQNNLNDGCGIKDNHILVFNNERVVNAGQQLLLSVTVTHINLENVGPGEGLYAPGHFNLQPSIVSNGRVSINNGSLALGESTSVRLTARPAMSTAVITGFTGCVNPDITVDPTSFTINDVPDFLMEEGNNLDIENPRINLVVRNTSPVDVNINGKLEGFYSGRTPVEVWVGNEHGTDAVLVRGHSTTVICLSRLGKGADVAAGEVNVKVPGLGDLITTIPDRIEMSSITAVVPQNKVYQFRLGTIYDFMVNYKAVIPLAFGPDLKFTYTTSDNGWDSDLDKYNFKEVVATIAVENTAPLNMVPKVHGIDPAGNVLTDITATVDGTVTAGNLGNPSKSLLTVTLKSTAANMGELDGIEFDFDATSSPDFIGVPLNIKQALRFTEIKLQLRGGVDIDIN